MDANLVSVVKKSCMQYGHDRSRMLDIVRTVQHGLGCVRGTAMEQIALELGTDPVEVDGVVTFYAFLSEEPKGRYVIRLCDDVVDKMAGADAVADALADATGLDWGQTDAERLFTIERTSCIGMSDQAPALLLNDMPFVDLDTSRVRMLVEQLRAGVDLQALQNPSGDGNNADPRIQVEVQNHIRQAGPLLQSFEPGRALRAASGMSPEDVAHQVGESGLRGRGGAGFPAGTKWKFTAAAEDPEKYLICNADEGEPGTFKDRVILTENPHLLIEGMTVAAYAIGAAHGILYLRAEYAYLKEWLESVLESRRQAGLLGGSINLLDGFSFDIRIQLGAGAYICGEETALISSCEGSRGDPKNRPPFPAQHGYLGHPTCVNNVETLAGAALVLADGVEAYRTQGTEKSPGTKLLSISGDCDRPGVYEVPFGLTLHEILALAGAEDVQAVQVGGAAGQLLPPSHFDRRVCFEDVATAGAIMVFGPGRDLLAAVHDFIGFFAEESCGYCTPCRVGNPLMKRSLESFMAGTARAADIDYLRDLAVTVSTGSRCGLGQLAPTPVLSAMEHFPQIFNKVLVPDGGQQPTFNIRNAVQAAEGIAGRQSVIYPEPEDT